jgi:hypothetical protein
VEEEAAKSKTDHIRVGSASEQGVAGSGRKGGGRGCGIIIELGHLELSQALVSTLPTDLLLTSYI